MLWINSWHWPTGLELLEFIRFDEMTYIWIIHITQWLHKKMYYILLYDEQRKNSLFSKPLPSVCWVKLLERCDRLCVINNFHQPLGDARVRIACIKYRRLKCEWTLASFNNLPLRHKLTGFWMRLTTADIEKKKPHLLYRIFFQSSLSTT